MSNRESVKIWIFRLLAVLANSGLALLPILFKSAGYFYVFWLSAAFFVVYGLVPFRQKGLPRYLTVAKGGYELTVTGLASLAVTAGSYLYAGLAGSSELTRSRPIFIMAIILALLVHFLVLANGTLRMFFASRQLGMYNRALFIFTWWIPIINLIVFIEMAKAVRIEYGVENEHEAFAQTIASGTACDTRYPIVMVHGVFFRDSNYFSYWGRIPKELKAQGARIYFGNQESALTVPDSAAEVKDRVMEVLRETKAEKVNIIAHSKGGLDSRYAISALGLAPCVASLTTINTPHEGCEYAEYLFHVWPKWWVNALAAQYNSALKKLGDRKPDFLGACWDLTRDRVAELNKLMPDQPGVLYQSVMSVLSSRHAASFPLNLTYGLVKKHDGPNDGLVGVPSGIHGKYLGLMKSTDRLGISHADVIDSTQRNIPSFDVRKMYVEIVRDLKAQGL